MIRHVTETIVARLAEATADLGDWIVAAAVDADAPALTANNLHVFLYGIDEHAHMRNLPLEPTLEGYVRPPLWLRLNYLFVYASNDHLETQARLTRVVQVFYTRPILRTPDLPPDLIDRVQTITVRLRSPSLEERNQVWTALGRPMRLALYYEVDVAPVPPLAAAGQGRVDELEIEFSHA